MKAIGGSVMPRVQHAANDFLVNAQAASNVEARKTAFPKRKRKRSLCSHIGRNRNEMFAGAPTAGRWNGFAVVDAAGDRFLQCVARLRERFGLVGARSKAFRKVPERNDDLAGRVLPEPGWITELHSDFLSGLVLPKVLAVKANLANHGGQKTWGDLLPAIFNDSLPRTVIQDGVTPFAALGVKADRHIPRCANFKNPAYEFFAFHIPGTQPI